MNDLNDLERMLADELSSVERGVAAPAVDVAGVAGVGRRERRRRSGILAAAGAAAAVVATVGALAVVPGLTRDSAGPPPAAPGEPDPDVPASVNELPVGPAGLAPYVVGSRLHVGRASSPLGRAGRFDVRYAAGTTVTVVEDGGVWSVLMAVGGDPFVQLATARAADSPFAVLPSADGAYVAVATREAVTRVEVSLFDAAAGGETLGSQSYDGNAVRDAFSLLNVTDDGRVLVSTDVFSIWSPGSQPVEVTGLGGVTGGQVSYPRGIATDGLDGTRVYGTISADGRFAVVGYLAQDAVVWSPSGSAWAFADPDTGRLFVDGEDRGILLLPLPTDRDWQPLGWESETDIVLEHVADVGGLDTQVRCDVVEVTCEQVPLEG